MLDHFNKNDISKFEESSIAPALSKKLEQPIEIIQKINTIVKHAETADNISEAQSYLKQIIKLEQALNQAFLPLNESVDSYIQKTKDEMSGAVGLAEKTYSYSYDKWRESRSFWYNVTDCSDDGFMGPTRRQLTDDKDQAKTRLDNAHTQLGKFKHASAIDHEEFSSIVAKYLLGPAIHTLKAAHGLEICHELRYYASNHQTSPDQIAHYLKHNSVIQQSYPELDKSYLALLKANYTTQDIKLLRQFAAKVDVTATPECKALVQFINHALIPHIDYFEIWASKINQLNDEYEAVGIALRDGNLDKRPELEILGETAISLSGEREILRPNIHASKKGEYRALIEGNKKKISTQENVTSLIAMLHDSSLGDLRKRHKLTCAEIEKYQKKYNKYFNNLETVLQEIDSKLGIAENKTEHAWNKFVSAENIRYARELTEFNSPERVQDIQRAILWAGVLARGAGGDISAAGEFAHGEVEINARYAWNKNEYKIKMEHFNKFSRLSATELEAEFRKLEEKVNQLVDSKEYSEFIKNSGLLQDIQAAYLLLPRLQGGETNIRSIEKRTSKAGYEKIDDFINELKFANPRLGKAMENSLLGLANSNDLKVLLAEANSIHTPQTAKEQVLVEYVENVIKKYYRDQSKQASIIDHLEMRNALYTGHAFHSFNEIVKMETDSALQALFSGTGDFSLVGSRDVHQMFDFYQTRHGGNDRFLDLLEHTKDVDRSYDSTKGANVVDSKELKRITSYAAEVHHDATPIPRLPVMFAEICAYEYLLCQGANIMKDRKLKHAPQVLGAYEMVNEITGQFIQKLALSDVRKQRAKNEGKEGYVFLEPQIESLIAQTFVDFFAELGAVHSMDNDIKDQIRLLKSNYTGVNFAHTSGEYASDITEKTADSFEMFLNIYKRNLEKYLEVATKENKAALLKQLAEVKDIMKDAQISDDILDPGSEEARLRAHYRNHSLSNVSLNHDTWVMRTEVIHSGGNRTVGK